VNSPELLGQRLIYDFGELLHWWPDVVAAAATLASAANDGWSTPSIVRMSMAANTGNDHGAA